MFEKVESARPASRSLPEWAIEIIGEANLYSKFVAHYCTDGRIVAMTSQAPRHPVWARPGDAEPHFLRPSFPQVSTPLPPLSPDEERLLMHSPAQRRLFEVRFDASERVLVDHGTPAGTVLWAAAWWTDNRVVCHLEYANVGRLVLFATDGNGLAREVHAVELQGTALAVVPGRLIVSSLATGTKITPVRVTDDRLVLEKPLKGSKESSPFVFADSERVYVDSGKGMFAARM